MPFVPFAAMGVTFFFIGRFSTREVTRRESERAQAAAEKARPEGSADAVEELLRLDTLALEVGVELMPLVDTAQEGEVLSNT